MSWVSADASMRSRELSEESGGMNQSCFGGARSRFGGNRSLKGMDQFHKGWPGAAEEWKTPGPARFVRALAADNSASESFVTA